MTVLVTGGNGFIGEHLVRMLVAAGATGATGEAVRVLDIAPPAPDAPAAEYIEGSILDPETVARAMTGVRRVWHLAANPDLWAPRKASFMDVNLTGTRNVLAAAAAAGVERLVHTSTESILKGRSGGDGRPRDETVEMSGADMPGPYCRSKFLAEQAALAAARDGLPVIVVNPTLPVGPGDRRLTPPTRMLLRFLNGAGPAYMDFSFNMIDVRDVARGHILAMERGVPGERYILGNENLRCSELLALLHDITGLSMPGLRVPGAVALVWAAVSELVADHITHRPPAAPLTGVRLARTPMIFDCSRAVRELGLPQTPLRRALVDAIAWFDETGLLLRRPAGPGGAAAMSRRAA